MLANHRSERAIAAWGADPGRGHHARPRLPDGHHHPHQSTIQRLLRRLDPVALAAALHRVFDPPPADACAGEEVVSVDGKAHRGRLAFAPQTGAPVHALTASLERIRPAARPVVLGVPPICDSGSLNAIRKGCRPA